MPRPGTSLAGHDHCTLHDPCHDSACSLQGTALALATSMPSPWHNSCYCKLHASSTDPGGPPLAAGRRPECPRIRDNQILESDHLARTRMGCRT